MAEHLLLARRQSWPRRWGGKARQEGRRRTRQLLSKHGRRSKLPPPAPILTPGTYIGTSPAQAPRHPLSQQLGSWGCWCLRGSPLVHRDLGAISSLGANHHSGEHDSRRDKGRGTGTIPFSLHSPSSSPHPPPASMNTEKGKTRQATLAKERVNKMGEGIQISITISSGK